MSIARDLAFSMIEAYEFGGGGSANAATGADNYGPSWSGSNDSSGPSSSGFGTGATAGMSTSFSTGGGSFGFDGFSGPSYADTGGFTTSYGGDTNYGGNDSYGNFSDFGAGPIGYGSGASFNDVYGSDIGIADYGGGGDSFGSFGGGTAFTDSVFDNALSGLSTSTAAPAPAPAVPTAFPAALGLPQPAAGLPQVGGFNAFAPDVDATGSTPSGAPGQPQPPAFGAGSLFDPKPLAVMENPFVAAAAAAAARSREPDLLRFDPNAPAQVNFGTPAVSGALTRTLTAGQQQPFSTGLPDAAGLPAPTNVETFAFQPRDRRSAQQTAQLSDPAPWTAQQGEFAIPPLARLEPVLEVARKDSRPVNPYNALVDGTQTPKYAPLTEMTVADVMRFQREQMPAVNPGQRVPPGFFKSKAVGGYQITGRTMPDAVRRAGINPNTTLFDEATQDRLAAALISGRTKINNPNASNERVANELGSIWASFKQSSGRGQYDGDGVNKGYVPFAEVVDAVNLARQENVPQFVAPAVPRGSTFAEAPVPPSRPQAGPGNVYGNIPLNEVPLFEQWNPDPIGNSAKALDFVHPDLARVVERAQLENPELNFVVGSGLRDPELQRAAVDWGWSQTMNSNHLDGNVVDIWAIDDQGRVTFDTEAQNRVADAMKAAADAEGVDLGWGGDWRGFVDRPHFELTNPRNVSAAADPSAVRPPSRPDVMVASSDVATSPSPTGVPEAVLASSPMGSGFPTGAQMRDINRRTDLAEPTVDELEAAEAAMMGNLPEGEISRAFDDPVAAALADQELMRAAAAREVSPPAPSRVAAAIPFGESPVLVTDFFSPVLGGPAAFENAYPLAVPDPEPPLAADREIPPVEAMPAPPGWDEAELGPWENVPNSTRAAIFGALPPAQREEVLAEMEREAVERPPLDSSPDAPLEIGPEFEPPAGIPVPPERPNDLDFNWFEGNVVPLLYDTALGVAFPPLGLANTVSGLLGGPSLGRFIRENMIPASDPRSFETIMNLPQFSTDTSYDSGDDDVFVRPRGGEPAPAPAPAPAPEPVRTGALSNLRRRYLGAGDDLRRYGMGPERVYYDEEPVEMAEGGFVDPFAMTDPLMDAGDYINEAAGRRRDEREARGEAFRDRLGETWPAQAARMAYEAVTLPGDVYAGRVDPMSDEGIGRATELGGLVTLGAAAAPAPRGALTMGAARRGGDLPMDEASRMARAREMGYGDEPFYRGDKGRAPNKYPTGGHFTRDPNYNAGGFGENREFRLNLENALLDDRPVTAGELGRLIEAAQKYDLQLARQLTQMVDKDDPEWVIGYGRARPSDIVDDSGAQIRFVVDRSAAPEAILKEAGFDFVQGKHGLHEVRSLTGKGIRHKDAVFDPARKGESGIFLGLGGAGLALPLMYPNLDQREE